VYQKMSYTTLRFNFRGVGNSQGSYDNGYGEQNDIRAAIAFLLDSGIKHVDLAGYSFGAWVLALVSADLDSSGNLVLISPPIDFIDFKQVKKLDQLKLVVVGSNDNFAEMGNLKRAVNDWNSNSRFEIIDGTDHFFSGYLDDLKNIIASVL